MPDNKEAFEKIKSYLEIVDYEDGEIIKTGDYEEQDAIDVVEKDIAKYNIIKEVLDEYDLVDYLDDEPKSEGSHCIDGFWSLIRYPASRITTKEQKFIEIAKTKKVNLALVNECESCEEYNGYYHLKLTEEEFNVCKEILHV